MPRSRPDAEIGDPRGARALRFRLGRRGRAPERSAPRSTRRRSRGSRRAARPTNARARVASSRRAPTGAGGERVYPGHLPRRHPGGSRAAARSARGACASAPRSIEFRDRLQGAAAAGSRPRRRRFRRAARRRALRLPACGGRRRRACRASRTSFAARTCSRRRRARSCCSACSGYADAVVSARARSPSTPPARSSPSRRAPQPLPARRAARPARRVALSRTTLPEAVAPRPRPSPSSGRGRSRPGIPRGCRRSPMLPAPPRFEARLRRTGYNCRFSRVGRREPRRARNRNAHDHARCRSQERRNRHRRRLADHVRRHPAVGAIRQDLRQDRPLHGHLHRAVRQRRAPARVPEPAREARATSISRTRPRSSRPSASCTRS